MNFIERTAAAARTKRIPAPKVYINEATSSLNNIMPHPQQTNKEAKHVAEKRNPIKAEMILGENMNNGKYMNARDSEIIGTCQPPDLLAIV